MIEGRRASTRASSSRRRSPPESVSARCFRRAGDVQLLEHLVDERVLVRLGELGHPLEDGAEVLLDRQPAEDARLLREVAHAALGALVDRRVGHVGVAGT